MCSSDSNGLGYRLYFKSGWGHVLGISLGPGLGSGLGNNLGLGLGLGTSVTPDLSTGLGPGTGVGRVKIILDWLSFKYFPIAKEGSSFYLKHVKKSLQKNDMGKNVKNIVIQMLILTPE